MTGNFIFKGKIINTGPNWNVTEFSDGSMRFRWNENNQNRTNFINKLQDSSGCQIAQLELTHSKDVFLIKSAEELNRKTGDGILTFNKKIIPMVTVADCVPIFFYDVKTQAFGVVHSGWKGTGIAEKAIEILLKNGSEPDNICVAIGPHIHQCCYEVQKDLQNYFTENFSTNCIKIKNEKIFLSLIEANLFILKKANIPHENIFISDECTCCFKRDNNFKYGSCRRQGKDNFVVQNAFIKF